MGVAGYRLQIRVENFSIATALGQQGLKGSDLSDTSHGETVRGVIETCSASLTKGRLTRLRARTKNPPDTLVMTHS